MNVDERTHFAGCVCRQIGAQRVEFPMHVLLGRAKTLDLAFDLRGFDQIVVYVKCSRGDQISPPDGDTA
jgi:hypothetical protein